MVSFVSEYLEYLQIWTFYSHGGGVGGNCLEWATPDWRNSRNDGERGLIHNGTCEPHGLEWMNCNNES